MDLAALALIWVIGSIAVAVIAQQQEKSIWLYLGISLVFSPLIGLASVLLIKRTLPDPEPQLQSVSTTTSLNADTKILTPEEANAMRERAAEQAKVSPLDTTEGDNANSSADTRVFTPEQMAALRQDIDKSET
jgi:hypothetical protein